MVLEAMSTKKIIAKDESETNKISKIIADFIKNKNFFCIFLEGELGAGKTTFTRYLLKNLGVTDKVKSPSYTVVESYTTKDINIHHFDLFRFKESNNFDWMALDEYFIEPAILIVEWPNEGFRQYVTPDISINITIQENVRCLETSAITILGQELQQLL